MPLEGVSRGFKDISFSFGKHPISNDLVTLSNESAISRAVRNLVLTKIAERPFNRDLGTKVKDALFENFDAITANIIEDEIRFILNRYEERITLREVSVLHDNDSSIVECKIQYEIVGRPNTLQELTFALESVR